MSESLVEKWERDRDEIMRNQKERGFNFPRSARIDQLTECINTLKARDAKIRNLLQKTGIAIRDLNTPRGIAEKFIREALALLDGQPEESTPTIKGFYGDPRDSA